MSLELFKDYVFVPKVWMITSDGVFVGTKNYVFCFASKVVEHEYRRVTTTTYSFKGKEIYEAIADVIKDSENVDSLEQTLVEIAEESSGTTWFKLDEITSFKVQAGFLGSAIHIQKAGKRGWSPFIQKLGKDKKEIQAYYQGHPKLK
ncbi:MAG: hypothetical protein GY880_00270 [Planctomycetaceae bacterium]|nr:hypothetical protein [Planctomycetaceae bacterium]